MSVVSYGPSVYLLFNLRSVSLCEIKMKVAHDPCLLLYQLQTNYLTEA